VRATDEQPSFTNLKNYILDRNLQRQDQESQRIAAIDNISTIAHTRNNPWKMRYFFFVAIILCFMFEVTIAQTDPHQGAHATVCLLFLSPHVLKLQF